MPPTYLPEGYRDFSLEQLGPFLSENYARGTLRVQAYAAQGLFPIQDAVVEVSAVLDGTTLPLYRRYTDESGVVDGLILPAKPKIDSQREETASGSGTLYTVSVYHPQYRSLTGHRVVIYDGVVTIYPALMFPNAM